MKIKIIMIFIFIISSQILYANYNNAIKPPNDAILEASRYANGEIRFTEMVDRLWRSEWTFRDDSSNIIWIDSATNKICGFTTTQADFDDNIDLLKGEEIVYKWLTDHNININGWILDEKYSNKISNDSWLHTYVWAKRADNGIRLPNHVTMLITSDGKTMSLFMVDRQLDIPLDVNINAEKALDIARSKTLSDNPELLSQDIIVAYDKNKQQSLLWVIELLDKTISQKNDEKKINKTKHLIKIDSVTGEIISEGKSGNASSEKNIIPIDLLKKTYAFRNIMRNANSIKLYNLSSVGDKYFGKSISLLSDVNAIELLNENNKNDPTGFRDCIIKNLRKPVKAHSLNVPSLWFRVANIDNYYYFRYALGVIDVSVKPFKDIPKNIDFDFGININGSELDRIINNILN